MEQRHHCSVTQLLIAIFCRMHAACPEHPGVAVAGGCTSHVEATKPAYIEHALEQPAMKLCSGTLAAKPFGARVALSTDFPCKHKSTAAWLGRLQVMPSNWMLLPWLGLAFKCMRSSFSTSNRHAKTGDEVTASMPGDGVVRRRCISRRHLERSRTTRCTFHVAATTIGSISESDVLGFSWLKGCGPSVAETET